jgi:hypothetical protein
MWFRQFVPAAACFIVLSVYVTGAGAIQLVTDQEAMLPDDPAVVVRGVTRGPDILVVSPAANAGLVRSPLTLKIKFRAYGGSKINRESILITYKKIPAIDMTQRIMPFIRADGIEIPGAELPPGTHLFRIDVKDTLGRSTAELFKIGVEK